MGLYKEKGLFTALMFIVYNILKCYKYWAEAVKKTVVNPVFNRIAVPAGFITFPFLFFTSLSVQFSLRSSLEVP